MKNFFKNSKRKNNYSRRENKNLEVDESSFVSDSIEGHNET